MSNNFLFEKFVKTLSTDELEDLCKEKTEDKQTMIFMSCPLTYLKELCDHKNFEVSFKVSRKYYWCFLRINGSIAHTTRVKFGNESPGENYYKRLVCQKMLDTVPEYVYNFYPERYDQDLIDKVSICIRELARRSPISPISSVHEIASRKKMDVKWVWNLLATGQNCTVTLRNNYENYSATSTTLNFYPGSKKESKELAAKELLMMLTEM
jgi:hypothetical protein